MRPLSSLQLKRVSGYTVIELMVSIAIGLVIMIAIGELFASNKISYRLQDDSSRLQESAGAAFDLLGYHIRQAGYVDISDDADRLKSLLLAGNVNWLKKTSAAPADRTDMIKYVFGASPVYTAGIQGIMGCDNGFVSTSSVALPWACGAGGRSAIIVVYQALPTTPGDVTVASTIRPYVDTLGAFNPTTGMGGDCGARDVNGAIANPKGPLAINMFYVDTATSRLMCTGNGDPSTPRPIAEGVEDMELLYGISPAAGGDTFVGQYVKAADVPDWTRVLSVRVCLQVASPNPVAPSVTSYTDCDGATKPQADGKLRRVFRATFSLRNSVLSMP